MLHFRESERIDPVKASDALGDELYTTALDHLVIACADVVLTQQRQVLLVRRNRYPRSDWWIVGGRMVAGEDPKQTAIRKAAQELGIDHLERDRLRYVGTYSTCFAFRHQSPQHHGSHTLNVTYALELTANELTKIVIHSDEHQTWQWFTVNDALHLLDTDRVMDRALVSVLQDLQPFLSSV